MIAKATRLTHRQTIPIKLPFESFLSIVIAGLVILTKKIFIIKLKWLEDPFFTKAKEEHCQSNMHMMRKFCYTKYYK